MNQLSFKTNPENGLSVELFIDGKSINDLFDVGDPFLPYWYFEDDLPYYSPDRKYETDLSRRLIGVCDCGEYGCGNLNCHVEQQNGLIVWSDFNGDVSGDQNVYIFVFDESQYVKTISEVVGMVDEYKIREKARNFDL